MEWWKAGKEYDFDLNKKIRTEGCREIKRLSVECRVLNGADEDCKKVDLELDKCLKILKHLLNSE
jgi:hypothetical protein